MKKVITLIILYFISFNVFPQNQFTPYDDLSAIEKLYKPTFQQNFTGWEKMLYEYPINFYEIEQQYQNYIDNLGNEKSPIIRYYKIWKRAVIPYVDEKGKIVLPDLNDIWNKRYNLQKNRYNKIKSVVANNGLIWSFLGPKETFWLNEEYMDDTKIDAFGNPKSCPWQVNVYSIDICKQDSSILYCGTETGYVNKSINNGSTWNLVGSDYLFGGAIEAIAINHFNADIVYVSAGYQIHKTIDGGETWMPLLNGIKTFNAVKLKINPDNPNIIVAASWDGLFISKDAGDTWEKKWDKNVYDVEFKPGNFLTIYGISKDDSGYFDIIISKNEGDSFSVSSNFPKKYIEASGGLLAVTPANSNLLYVSMLCTENNQGIPYIVKGELANGDFVWSETKKGSTSTDLSSFNNGQGYFDFILEAAPDDENLIYWGTCSLYKSIDGGYNFNKIGGYGGNFPIHPDIQDIQVLKNGMVWVSTDGGINYSSDHFTDIDNYTAKNKNLIGSDMWGFDQGWNEDIIVGGRYHNGNTALADFYNDKALRMGGAESATGWVLKGKSRHVVFNDLGNGWQLPKTAEDYPDGRFIFSKYPNMDEYGGRRSNLVQHPNYYNTIYIGSENQIWVSHDLGITFDLLYQFTERVRFLQISHKNPNVIYADIVGKGLYRSDNGGKSWNYKPTLTKSYADTYWAGKLHFVISPYDKNRIYVCLNNGAWSNDYGEVYMSKDGGDSWENLTNNLTVATKCLAIQPTNDGRDLIYLFTLAKNGQLSKVFYKYQDDNSWTEFDNNYPAGMGVNLALPFYRDGKIRVAGNAGVWETYLVETDFTPIVTPWVQTSVYNCMEDTLYFDDHSILNHNNTKWSWDITPEPSYISDKNIRNPKVVLGSPGSYDVKLTITKGGRTYSKMIKEMVNTTTCPSIFNCDKPGQIDQSNFKLIHVDSEESNYADRTAGNAFDGDPATFWHTAWSQNVENYPHELQLDLGRDYLISKFSYLPRQDGSVNGRINEYELYISSDDSDFEDAVISDKFEDTQQIQEVLLESPKVGRYIKLKSLSEQRNQAFTSIAELNFTGCVYSNTMTIMDSNTLEIKAYPIPAKDKITVSLPITNIDDNYKYQIFSSTGSHIKFGNVTTTNGRFTLNVAGLYSGVYYLVIFNNHHQKYRIKFMIQ